MDRSKDWFDQAVGDLEHAKADLERGFYDWACFSTQQAAEKAVKAVYQALSVEVWGHSVSKFLQQLPEPYRPPRDLVDKAKELNMPNEWKWSPVMISRRPVAKRSTSAKKSSLAS